MSLLSLISLSMMYMFVIAAAMTDVMSALPLLAAAVAFGLSGNCFYSTAINTLIQPIIFTEWLFVSTLTFILQLTSALIRSQMELRKVTCET